MRAVWSAAVAAALVGLAGCGQANEPTSAAPRTSVESQSTLATAIPPKPPSVVPQPTTKPQTPPGDPTAPVSMSPTGPVVPPGVTQVPSAQVDASGVPEYYDHRGLVFVYDGGRSLQMFAAASSGCGEVQAVVTSSTATDVRIEMRALPQPNGGPADAPACTTVITPRPVTVALDAPLGDRIVHLTATR